MWNINLYGGSQRPRGQQTAFTTIFKVAFENREGCQKRCSEVWLFLKLGGTPFSLNYVDFYAFRKAYSTPPRPSWADSKICSLCTWGGEMMHTHTEKEVLRRFCCKRWHSSRGLGSKPCLSQGDIHKLGIHREHISLLLTLGRDAVGLREHIKPWVKKLALSLEPNQTWVLNSLYV